MRKVRIVYTVVLHADGFPVTYLDPKTVKVRTLSGPFHDPGEASQEFQARIGGKSSYYLAPTQFRATARALARLRREKAKGLRAQRV